MNNAESKDGVELVKLLIEFYKKVDELIEGVLGRTLLVPPEQGAEKVQNILALEEKPDDFRKVLNQPKKTPTD